MGEISDSILQMVANDEYWPTNDEKIAMARELQRRRAEARQAPLPAGTRPVCTDFVADPCGSACCASCGKRRAEHLQSPLPAGTVTEESDDAQRGWSEMQKREAEILHDHEIGNLTELGVANYLVRAGFNRRYATEKANTLKAAFAARPAEPVAVKEAAEFLLDRLEDLERGWDDEEAFREYNGHVAPAAARLRSALVSATAPGLVEALRSAVWVKVGECLAGLPHTEVSRAARRKIETAISAALSITETGGAK